jgi:hypothetical protein
MSDYVPYEKTHRLRQLLFVTTIVDAEQGDAIIQINYDNEAAICLQMRGKGTAPKDVALLNGTSKKDVIFSILRADKWGSYKAQLENRFAVSKAAKGIAYATPLDSVAGVSIYKMLSNTRQFEKPMKAVERKKGMKKK